MIRKLPNKRLWRLYSRSGKNLGTFKSYNAAQKHEYEIEYFKHNVPVRRARRKRTNSTRTTSLFDVRNWSKNL